MAYPLGSLCRTIIFPFYFYSLTFLAQPCKVDYSDLYDIMSFFAGPPDGHAGGHDNLAKMIADQARQFGEDHWRWEDMQAYMFRLLLE